MAKDFTIRSDKLDKEKIQVNDKMKKLCDSSNVCDIRAFYILKIVQTFILNPKVCKKQERQANTTTKERHQTNYKSQ